MSFSYFSIMPFYYPNVHTDVSIQYLFAFFFFFYHQSPILVYLYLDEIAFSCMFTRLWTSITSIGRSGHMVR